MRNVSWRCLDTWKVSSKNTVVCLIGCMSGDLTAWYYLNTYFATWPILLIMFIAVVCGLCTSVLLETCILLRQMSFPRALKTAFGMSVFSMLAMEVAANSVAYFFSHGDRMVWWVIIYSLMTMLTKTLESIIVIRQRSEKTSN